MGFEPHWRGASSFKARRLNHLATEVPLFDLRMKINPSLLTIKVAKFTKNVKIYKNGVTIDLHAHSNRPFFTTQLLQCILQTKKICSVVVSISLVV